MGKHHPRLKQLGLLKEPAGRRQEGLFLVEGVRLLEEALGAGLVLERLFYRSNLSDARALALRNGHSERTTELPPESLARLSETEQDQGLVGLFQIPARIPQELAQISSLLVLEKVSDPGNLGTLIRGARAAGVGGVALIGGVDPYNSKVLRSSAGALFWVPLWQQLSLAEVAGAGFQLLAAVARGGQDYYHCAPALLKKPAWLLGGEAQGLSPAALKQAAARVTLPMAAGCESLNVAMAGTVMMFDWRRRMAEVQT
jgi:TrmH family RNA methyltransferase